MLGGLEAAEEADRRKAYRCRKCTGFMKAKSSSQACLRCKAVVAYGTITYKEDWWQADSVQVEKTGKGRAQDSG